MVTTHPEATPLLRRNVDTGGVGRRPRHLLEMSPEPDTLESSLGSPM